MNLENIRVVLIETSHPGNIGATARAMKNMGLKELVLVNPKYFPHDNATERAGGADDILANALIVDDLKTAIADCELVMGTSARERSLPWPSCDPRQAAEKISPVSHQANVALVFGRERTGLFNEELHVCHWHIIIPTNSEYSSLNLAAAVQVICYELRMTDMITIPLQEQFEWATADEMQAFYCELEKVLTHIKFYKPELPRQLLPRMQRLFNRARLEKNEMTLLRGIFAKILRTTVNY